MPKYRGRVDCYLNPAFADSSGNNSRVAGEAFVNIVQHISSSMSDLGIEMIASNYGTGSTGWNFWDEAGPTGHNSFACFRFHSASLGKFDCLIYCVTGSSVAMTSPVTIDSNNSTNNTNTNRGVGIAFSMHPSGSTLVDGPWNGTLDATNGPGSTPQAGVADVNTPLWKLAGDYGATLPRSNGEYGNTSGSRGGLMGMLSPAYPPVRLHTILSEDSVTIISDVENNGSTKILHFGPYTPRSGSTPVPQSPYFLYTTPWDSSGATPSPILVYGNTIPRGDASPSPYYPSENQWNGGIAHPNLVSGSRLLTLLTVGISQPIAYNNFINSGTFEKFPLWAGVYESADIGILGIAKHITAGIGMTNYSVSELSSSAAFGNMTQSDYKLLVPWQGDAPNTSPTLRTGRTFSFNT